MCTDRSQIVAGEHFPKYQRISAFWFRGVFLQSRLQSVKYIMRLDTESRLLGTIEYDLFDYMESTKIDRVLDYIYILLYWTVTI